MPSQHPLTKLREIEQGLGLLAAEIEAQLQTKPINLLYWRRELREVIAELQDRRWQPTSGTPSSCTRPADHSQPRDEA